MINRIKKIIPTHIKQQIIYYTSKDILEGYNYNELKTRKKVFVMLAADYGNIGDMAITHAQKLFLKNMYPQYEIIELTVSQTYRKLRRLKKVINKDDIITLIGGGNMSNEYKEIETQRRFIIKKFKNNKIISFPQTIDYSDDNDGLKSLDNAKKIYSNHPDLTILSREKISFQKMKEIFKKNKIILTPDIVMSLNELAPMQYRKGLTLCLRNDKERKINDSTRKKLIEKIYTKYDTVSEYDTWIGEGIFTIEERDKELNSIWNAFKKSEVVLTDRLHGMIFAYITGTPCVALPNSNHKLIGCYEWIKECGYIRLCQTYNINEILNEVEYLLNIIEEDKKYINLVDNFVI